MSVLIETEILSVCCVCLQALRTSNVKVVLINPGPIATDMTKVSHQGCASNLMHELSQLNAHCVLHHMKYAQQDVFQDVSDMHWHGNRLVGTYFAFCLACSQQGLGQICQACSTAARHGLTDRSQQNQQ